MKPPIDPHHPHAEVFRLSKHMVGNAYGVTAFSTAPYNPLHEDEEQWNENVRNLGYDPAIIAGASSMRDERELDDVWTDL